MLRKKHIQGQSKNVQKPIGHKAWIWYPEESKYRVHSFKTREEWDALPKTGIIGIQTYYKGFDMSGTTRLRRNISGDDFYWMDWGGKNYYIGQQTNRHIGEPEIQKKYPLASIKEGSYVDDEIYHNIIEEMSKDYDVSDFVTPVKGTSDMNSVVIKQRKVKKAINFIMYLAIICSLFFSTETAFALAAANFTTTDTDSDLHGLFGDPYDKMMNVGATAGTATDNISLASSAVNSGVCGFTTPLNVPNNTSWASGNWVIRFEVVTANMNITWNTVVVQQRTSTGTFVQNVTTYTTTLGISLGTTGVKSSTQAGSALTVSATDRVTTVTSFDNGAMSTQTADLKFSQNIDSPLTVVSAGPQLKSVNGLANASVKTFNGLAIASVKAIDGLSTT